MPAVCLKGNDSLAELFLLRLQNSPSKEQIVLCQLIIFAFCVVVNSQLPMELVNKQNYIIIPKTQQHSPIVYIEND